MGIVMDVALVGILAISMFSGYRKGLINVIFNLCAFLVAIIVTIVLYKPVARIVMNNTNLYENVKQAVLDNGITEKKNSNSEEGYSIDKYIEKYTYNAITDAKNDAVEATADTIAINTVNIIVSIALFIVVRILLIFAKTFVGALAELPVIKQFNKLGGVLYGAIVGLIIIYVALAIMFFVVSVNGAYDLIDVVENSVITKHLYFAIWGQV